MTLPTPRPMLPARQRKPSEFPGYEIASDWLASRKTKVSAGRPAQLRVRSLRTTRSEPMAWIEAESPLELGSLRPQMESPRKVVEYTGSRIRWVFGNPMAARSVGSAMPQLAEAM